MPKKVLIVDDDHATHMYIADLLQMYGYDTGCVHSAATAQQLVPLEPPDFLVLDLHMERLYAGWELLQQLRTNPATSAIPAVLATSDHDFVRLKKADVQALGAEVMEKPFPPQKLVDLIAAKVPSE